MKPDPADPTTWGITLRRGPFCDQIKDAMRRHAERHEAEARRLRAAEGGSRDDA